MYIELNFICVKTFVALFELDWHKLHIFYSDVLTILFLAYIGN